MLCPNLGAPFSSVYASKPGCELQYALNIHSKQQFVRTYVRKYEATSSRVSRIYKLIKLLNLGCIAGLSLLFGG